MKWEDLTPDRRAQIWQTMTIEQRNKFQRTWYGGYHRCQEVTEHGRCMYSPTQTATIEYQDKTVKMALCEQHLEENIDMMMFMLNGYKSGLTRNDVKITLADFVEEEYEEQP